jgi:signal transduction histidine kinase
MSSRVKIWGVGLACLVLVQTAAFLLSGRSFGLVALSDTLQSLLLLSAFLSCIPSIFRHRGRTRLFWTFMAVGLASWLSYQLVWTYVEVIQRKEVPDLFSWDALLFLHFVPMMAALALQPNVEAHDRDWRSGSLDFALLLLWWVYVYVYSVLPWQLAYISPVAYQLNLNTSYLVEKVALLGGLALLWYRSSGGWKTIYGHWFVACLFYSTSSYVANWALARHTYYSGSFYDIALMISMAWMSLPGLLALDMPVAETKSAKSLPRGVWAGRLGMVAVFSLPVFAWFSEFDTAIPQSVRNFRLLLTLAAMLIMGAIVFIKQHFLDVELIRLLRASRQSFQELQLLQAQLVQSEKLASMGQLVGGAAHELNNPLTAMLGYAELLTATELTPEQRSLAAKISQQTKRVRSLVSSLLSFAKQVPSSKTPVDVNAILQTCLKMSQPQMEVARVKSSIEMANPLPRVQADSNQLLQVFSHIINNAVNAMSERGGTITISTRSERDLVIIQFADTGPGMVEPDRVFDPFYTTRPVGQGIGLGLSACYGIIQQHGGKISGSNRETGGAIFQVDLPAAPKAAEAEFAQAHAASKPS